MDEQVHLRDKNGRERRVQGLQGVTEVRRRPIEFEDEVDLLMSSDIVSAQISTKPITFSTVQSGWFFKEDRKWCDIIYHFNFQNKLIQNKLDEK